MPFEIWIASTSTPVAFQPERVNLPPIATRAEAQELLHTYHAGDRRALIIERDELGNVVPTEDELAIAQQAHDAEVDAATSANRTQITTEGFKNVFVLGGPSDDPRDVTPAGGTYDRNDPDRPSAAGVFAGTADDGAGDGSAGGAAPEWQHRSFVDVLLDRWRDGGLIDDRGNLKPDEPEAAAQIARDVVLDMLALDVNVDDVPARAT